MVPIGRLLVSPSNFPYGLASFALYTGRAELCVDSSVSNQAMLEIDDGKRITSEDEIMWSLASTTIAGASNEGSTFFALAHSLNNITEFDEVILALDKLDDHCAFRTYLVGHDITASDWMIWGAIKGSIKLLGILKSGRHLHLLRWFSHLESHPSAQSALHALAEAKVAKARSGSKTASSFALGLPGATINNVVTRFPPEPSGYLHIGHAKAAMLNQYFAKMYGGRLIIRFDDTNPSKERTEFEETILDDLRLLGIEGDTITHTSDHFDKLHEFAIQMIKSGKAYADDTDNSVALDLPCSCPGKQHGKQSRMAYERWHGIPSLRRDASVEENLSRFAEMRAGTAEGQRWCIRAKISVDDPNKAMRDPVVYRTNTTPHHRAGDKWKVYPTYDFACPVVDSLEGVTHALRTNEYRDRNLQYMWMNDALGLRPVQIWDFSRLNFVYTLLSKRKLHWFVDQGLVRGWDDPRLPTVRGIRRRGMTVEGLRQFMLSQGPSQAVVLLEWDSIWALNKKVIDPVAPRFWALLKSDVVPVTVINGPTTPELVMQPKHKKNAAVGEKKVVYASSILIEQADAITFEEQEEITLMSWGNAIVRSRELSGSGQVLSMTMELNLQGDFRLTKKKVTWLAAPSGDYRPLADVTFLDYDYLITKKKVEEGDSLTDLVTPVTEFREEGVADANVLELTPGDIIQFERKGYYIYDGKGGKGQGKMEFIRIPDGKAASLASKAGV
ncbi:glutamyl-tRNA synthetase [Stereum hirsutum FP-91666 SS1]|uniref:glutamyl-tRNA synthetase n=1 Tax=Stereum hirsutum (strain FP-91666) TaxID=721885 RepID=UPI0004449853|nr:glutamyl-tRNA synthetase [Stereum hirsutum FP-91666 SS1]EIM86286.1 glutamyl-tRNA synthetase [Stereum hirsutum FP-91666 SS1]